MSNPGRLRLSIRLPVLTDRSQVEIAVHLDMKKLDDLSHWRILSEQRPIHSRLKATNNK